MNCFQVGCHVRPCDGEAVSGDAVVVRELPDGVFLSLIDALGHGREAAQVALRAIRFLKQDAGPDVEQTLRGLHDQLEGTRGAAASVAFADRRDGSIACTGIGNTVVRRVGRREQRYPAPDGILGVRFRTPRIHRLSLESDELLLLYSDGIDEHFPQIPTAALCTQTVDMLARRIVLDHGKSYDDAACIALRYQP